MIGGRRVQLEWPVVLPALLLMVTGVVVVWSAKHQTDPMMWRKQVAFAVAGCVAAAVVVAVGVRVLRETSWEVYGLMLLVLVALPFVSEPGRTGAVRWIRLPLGFKLQPSEFMKIALVLALARYLRHAGVTNTWRSYLGPFVLFAVPWFLVMRQPDLGTSLVLVPLTVAMVVTSGARLRHVVILVLASGLLLLGAYHTEGVLKHYQRERVDAFLRENSVHDMVVERRAYRQAEDHERANELVDELRAFRRGIGYQQYYGVVALGAGGLTGQGLGQGMMNNADSVAVSESDFVFAILGEELGLAGTLWVLALHGALAAAVLGVAHRTREPFGRLVCVGTGALVGSQALMNMGIVTGLLPVTGLTLPLVSYGGSSMVSTCEALGCVLAVADRREAVFFEQ